MRVEGPIEKKWKVRPKWDKTKHGLRKLSFFALKARAFRWGAGEREKRSKKRRRRKEEKEAS